MVLSCSRWYRGGAAGQRARQAQAARREQFAHGISCRRRGYPVRSQDATADATRIMSEIGGPLDDGGIAPARRSFRRCSRAGWRRRKKPSPTKPTPWRWPRWTRRAAPMSAWCCSRAGTQDGFVFYTNKESAKGGELAAHPHAALCFHWKSCAAQVRVRGPVTRSERRGSRCLFRHPRPRTARSAPGPRPSRGRWKAALRFEKEIAKYAAKYALGQGAAAALLDRLSRHAVRDRILARPAVPPA